MALQPTSAAELDAVLGHLVRSARRFSMPSVSYNYLELLHQTLG